jgi:hypothetical protein
MWDLAPTRQPQMLNEDGVAIPLDWWFVAYGWATWVNGDRAVSIWLRPENQPFPEVNASVMAVPWIPSKKVNTRVGSMRFETEAERQAVWDWLILGNDQT